MRSTFRSLKAALLAGGLGLGITGVALPQEEEAVLAGRRSLLGAYVRRYGALRSDNNAKPVTS